MLNNHLNKLKVMPRAKTHVKTGFFVGFLFGGLVSLLKQLSDKHYEADKKMNWIGVVVWGCIGGVISAIFSLLPDMLEPAYTPNHRGFFHSYTVLGLLALALFKIDQSIDLNLARKSLTFCAIIGYGSHLILDSKTPAGLDLI